MSAGDNIQVGIRIRPLIKFEKEKNLRVQWNVHNNNIYQIDEFGQRNGELYSFDHIFEISKSNAEIYEDIVKEFVDSSLNGLNSTIFAYGQTSSGKTYTMLGNDKDKGIMLLAIDHIFDSIANDRDRKFLLRVSYVEIYNERIHDLLDPNNKDIKIRESLNGVIQLQNVKEELVSTREQVFDLLKIGAQNRHIGATNINERSSRSHTILKMTIESAVICDFDDINSPVQMSMLNLVDLAGSERVAQTKATGARLKEGGHINKSLSNLGLVIRQLSDGQEYVNFRDSKLTRLLQHSLGGNGKTLIIATVTVTSVEDTSSTLSFAQRAKAVKNKPQINEMRPDSTACKEYHELNNQLRQRLKEQEMINQNLERTKVESSKEILRLQEQIQMLETFLHGRKSGSPLAVLPKRRHTICFTGQKGSLKSIIEESEEIKEERICSRRELFKSEVDFQTPGSSGVHLSVPSSTPEGDLRVRYRALEQEHRELIAFTNDERQIFNEASTTIEELQQKLNHEINNMAEMKRRRREEEEFITTHMKNKFKVREEELLARIASLEKALKEKGSAEDKEDFSSEFKYLQDKLIALHTILDNSEFVGDQRDNVANLHEIIESFNAKLKSAKEMIESEIWKQVNYFEQASEPLNNEPLILPNELESFNRLLNELSNFENELPPEVTSSNKLGDIQTVKILHKVYESLLKKNNLLGRFSEKVGSLQDEVKHHYEQVEQLKELVAGKEDLENILKKLQLENGHQNDKLREYQDIIIKITHDSMAEKHLNTELKQSFNNLQEETQRLKDLIIEKDTAIERFQRELKVSHVKLEENNENCHKAWTAEKERLRDRIIGCNQLLQKSRVELIDLREKLFVAQHSIPYICYFENEDLRHRITELENDKTALEEINANHFERESELRNTLNMTDTHIHGYQRQLQAHRDLFERAQNRINHLKKVIEDLDYNMRVRTVVPPIVGYDQKEIDDLVKNKAKEVVELKYKSLIDERNNLERQCKECDEENCRLKLKIKCLEEEKSRDNTARTRMASELTEAYLKINLLEQAQNRLTRLRRNPAVEDTGDGAASSSSSFINLKLELEKFKHDHCGQIRTFIDEIARLNGVITETKEETDRLMAKANEDDQTIIERQLEIISLEEIVERLTPLETMTEKLNCDIKQYQSDLKEVQRKLDESKDINNNLRDELKTLKNSHEMALEDNEKVLKRLQKEMDDYKVENSNLQCDNSKLVHVLSSIIEHCIKEEKAVLTTKLTQDQRDMFKNIKKDLKDNNASLRTQIQAIQLSNNHDLDKITELIIKSSELLRQYFNLEKEFSESRIEKLENTSKEYLQEISALKEINKNGCPNCPLIKNEVSDLRSLVNSKEMQLSETLAKLRDLQEKLLATDCQKKLTREVCTSCEQLQNKCSKLNKQYREAMTKLVHLEFGEPEKEAKPKDDLLELYVESDKAQKKKIEEYEAVINVPKNSTGVQCEILCEDEVLRRKYNKMKEICHKRLQENEALRSKLAKQ